MDKDREDPKKKPRPAEGDKDWPPPFNPDPRLVRYLEGGSKSDAEKRFRQAIKRLEKEREQEREKQQ